MEAFDRSAEKRTGSPATSASRPRVPQASGSTCTASPRRPAPAQRTPRAVAMGKRRSLVSASSAGPVDANDARSGPPSHAEVTESQRSVPSGETTCAFHGVTSGASDSSPATGSTRATPAAVRTRSLPFASKASGPHVGAAPRSDCGTAATARSCFACTTGATCASHACASVMRAAVLVAGGSWARSSAAMARAGSPRVAWARASAKPASSSARLVPHAMAPLPTDVRTMRGEPPSAQMAP